MDKTEENAKANPLALLVEGSGLEYALPRATEPLLCEVQAAPGLKPAIKLTDAGKQHVMFLAYHNNPKIVIARSLGMSHDWLEKQYREDAELVTLLDQADALGEHSLRAAGMRMAMHNPAQNQFERKVRMGEGIEKQEVDVNHKHFVVGMLPDDKELTNDEWIKAFSPNKEESESEH